MMSWAKWISAVTMGLLLCADAATARAQSDSQQAQPVAEPAIAARPGSAEYESDYRYDANYAADSDTADGETDGYQYPQPDDEAGVDTNLSADGEETEVIKERFPNGAVHIEREVTQDAAGNYMNHGSWKMWDEAGNLLAQGQYNYGNRAGTWVRWYRNVNEAPMLKWPPFNQFTGPFISQATFADGQLNGYWTIYDGKVRKISQWRFVNGRRHGISAWWHANGRKMREIEFRDGDIDGRLTEWSQDGKVALNETYRAGRKLAEKTDKYPDGKKKSVGMYLFAKDVEKTPDDWWECKLVSTIKSGHDEKHGAWASWHANGQRQLEGTYEHDVQVGLFTWWHQNGQKALEGRYDQGKQDGSWTWWYASGQKSIQGSYEHGNPTGRWTWWREDGKVAQSADLSNSEGIVIQEGPRHKPNTLPHVQLPTPNPPKRR